MSSVSIIPLAILEPIDGIEPSPDAYHAPVLPLNYTGISRAARARFELACLRLGCTKHERAAQMVLPARFELALPSF